MEIVHKTVRMRAVVDELRRQNRTVGLVPTMGGIHSGHLSLVRLARERGAEVVVSIFVNPKQFAEGEDFETYPRDLTRDSELLAKEGVKFVFAPNGDEMYPEGSCTTVGVDGLSDVFTGEQRPGHFRGVTRIVLQLLNIIGPDFAVFGWKDAQQLIIIQRMVRDLAVNVEIVPAPTVRDPDGLAASTRNASLTDAGRKAARSMYRALQAAAKMAEDGERSPQRLEATVREVLEEEESLEIDFVAVVDPETLTAPKRIEHWVLILVSVQAPGNGEKIRLIDNFRIEVPKGSS